LTTTREIAYSWAIDTAKGAVSGEDHDQQEIRVMNQAFEFYQGSTSEDTTTPRVTVRKSGHMVLTPAALELMGKEVTQVQIGFNAETRAVGIRPAEEGAKGKYRLRHQNGSAKRLVDGKRFFAHVGVPIDKAASFEVEDFGDGIIGFYVRESQEPAENAAPVSNGKTGGRRKKASS
jgi:hypothetical protein